MDSPDGALRGPGAVRNLKKRKRLRSRAGDPPCADSARRRGHPSVSDERPRLARDCVSHFWPVRQVHAHTNRPPGREERERDLGARVARAGGAVVPRGSPEGLAMLRSRRRLADGPLGRPGLGLRWRRALRCRSAGGGRPWRTPGSRPRESRRIHRRRVPRGLPVQRRVPGAEGEPIALRVRVRTRGARLLRAGAARHAERACTERPESDEGEPRQSVECGRAGSAGIGDSAECLKGGASGGEWHGR